jgi:hypothetical protein
METFKNQLLSINRGDYTIEQLVSILILCASNIEIYTISEMARKEGKTHRGIKISNKYRKVSIGNKMFAIKGLSNKGLPF